MNRKMWIGIAMVVASYGQLLVPQWWAVTHHFLAGFVFSPLVALFALGVIFISEGIVQRLGGVSLMSLALGGGWPKLVRFLAVAFAAGALVEIGAQWLGKLWYYAYYPSWFYWPSFVPSFILYWLLIVESYLAAKAILDRFIKFGGRQSKLRDYTFEPWLYGLLGMAGVALLVVGIIGTLFLYRYNGGYTFDPLHPVPYAPPLRYILMIFIGLWFVGEAVLFGRQLPSLFRSLLHGYIVPLLALVGASVGLSLLWEAQNAPVGYWVYTNWPWPQLTIFHVQLSVLATWPANYVVYLTVPLFFMASWAPVFWARPLKPALATTAETSKHE